MTSQSTSAAPLPVPQRPPGAGDGDGLVELTRAQCLALLATQDVGRLVFTSASLPAIVPVAYLLDGDSIVLRTSAGSRVARHAVDTVVAFEVDQVSRSLHSGWSVVVTGRSAREEDPGVVARLQQKLPRWVGGERDVVLRIGLELVTGRRVPFAGSAARGGPSRAPGPASRTGLHDQGGDGGIAPG